MAASNPMLEKSQQMALDAKARKEAKQLVRRPRIERSRPVELEILERVSHGETLLAITTDLHMPTPQAIRGWAEEDPEGFGTELQKATEELLLRMADETLQIADDSSEDWEERTNKQGEKYIALNKEALMRSKLRIDTRRWYLSMMSPKFQEQTNLNVKGAIAVAHITDQDRARRVAALMGRVAARERRLEDDLAPAIDHDDIA